MDEAYESLIIIPIMADRTLHNNLRSTYNYEIQARIIVEEKKEPPIEKTFKDIFSQEKPISEMSKRELLILIIKILLYKQGYSFESA
jgi:hypothetical protein